MLHVGDPAPALTLTTDAGEPWSIADLAGRPVVLVFHRHFY